ncbi:MAG: tetratricopeptide repeat protein [Acidobacteriota bacterium]|nr:tetratricopeptide repeat protein [Acidobacteriota bacterium]
MRIEVLLGTLAVLPAIALLAQQGPTPASGGGGVGIGTGNAGLGSSGARSGDGSRSVYISGKVAMADGSPVPADVTIQRICGGISRTVAYADSKGRFSFQWSDRNNMVVDAGDAGQNRNSGTGFGSSQSAAGSGFNVDPFSDRMMNCQVRAYLAGYTSDNVNLFDRRLMDSPDVGIIGLHRIPGVEGTSISATTLAAPKDAKKAYDHGLQALAKSKKDEALKDFEKATSLYPKFADAWVNLGKLLLEQQKTAEARTALVKAIECDPKLVTPYLELGALSASEAKWQESRDYLDRGLKLDPVDFPQAWYTDAVANYNLKRYDAAEKSAREAVRLDPRHLNPRADYLLGLILAEKQDYEGAEQQLQAYLQLAPNAPDLASVRDQLGQLEKLKGEKKPSPPVQKPE